MLVTLKGGDAELAKDIAMHVAASNPAVLSPADVSEELIAKEKEIFLQLNADKIAGKPENIVENMIKGRINKFLAKPAWLSSLSSRIRKSRSAIWPRKPARVYICSLRSLRSG
ncbi:Elongation factor Ts, mitochondrial [Stutzerimonas stutzeri]